MGNNINKSSHRDYINGRVHHLLLFFLSLLLGIGYSRTKI